MILPLLLTIWSSAHGYGTTVKQVTVEYSVKGKVFKGHLAYTPGKILRPGVLIAPEWWGLSSHEKDVAKHLAEQGYTALAIDLYGAGRHTSDPDQANTWMQEAQKSDSDLREIFSKAMELLKKQPGVDPNRVAAIGFGFGGGVTLEQARNGVPLKSVAVFYAGLGTNNRLIEKQIAPEILVLTGQNDQYVDQKEIADFKSLMTALKVRHRIVMIADAYPSFANPLVSDIGKKYQMPFLYSKTAAEKAWAEVDPFLKRTLAAR